MNSGTASASSTLRSPLATPTRGPRTFTQYLAAIRMLGDWLVVSQVLPVNPAAAVRGPKHVVTKGATPVLSPAEARKLLASIDTGALAGLRDQALLSVMLYSFAPVSAMSGMRRQDCFGQGSRGWLRLHEKGGKCHDVSAHHRAAAALDAYVEASGLEEPKAALFQTVDPAGRRLTGPALDRRLVLAMIKRRAAAATVVFALISCGRLVLEMIKRRAAAAGLPPSTCCHRFRATGITAYLSNRGTLERAQQITGHASPRTTKLYDRTGHGDRRRDRAHRDLSVDVPCGRRQGRRIVEPVGSPWRLRRACSRVWRWAGGGDISVIPSIAIRQAEVLRDGAAAQYGSDAIAGVMNSQLKDDNHGGALEFRTSAPFRTPTPAAWPSSSPCPRGYRSSAAGSRYGFDRAENALARLYSLAQALANDLARFQALVGR